MNSTPACSSTRWIAARLLRLGTRLQIEEPLRDAINYAEALRLMGHGIVALDDNGGDAVVALAWQTSQRLERVKTLWNKMLEERRKIRRAKLDATP